MIPAGGRRHDVDWLRVLAMSAVFLFHTARFFDHDGWHVKNGELSLGFSVLVGVMVLWLMPIFFVLSGFSVKYSLSKRSAGRFLLSRVRRLGVPLVFGILVLVPPQVYIERVSHGQYRGSFFEWFPRYFDGLYAFGGNFAWMGLHLWFLMLLLILSVLLLPMFKAMSRWESDGALTRMAGFLSKPGAIFLLALPLTGMQLLVDLQPGGVGLRALGGWSPLVYLVFFWLGRLIAGDQRYSKSIQRHRWPALGLALVLTGLLMAARLASGLAGWCGPTGAYLAGGIARTLSSWCWIVAFLGFAGRQLNFSSRVLAYCNQAVLPFYVLHQSVIVMVAFSLIAWEAIPLVKYLLLALISFAVIAVLYEGPIRRLGPLRFLFGMQPRSAI